MRADSDHLQFLTCLNANVLAAVTECTSDGRELLLQGTRGGILFPQQHASVAER